MKALYDLVIFIYTGLIHISSVFNQKALLWVRGRKRWAETLKQKINSDDKHLWIHCASLGEFEQGRPVIEKIKKYAPDYKIILTFFSPSGYEIRKNYQYADYICYLPADTAGNASKFIGIVRPALALFVKYEFWYNYISVLHKNRIPLYLVSGIFRPGHHFFKWYGGFFRSILKKFTHIFLQDNISRELLSMIRINNTTVAGDTRFDRVNQIAGTTKDFPEIEKFKGNEVLFLSGSSWRPDEEIIARYINTYPGKMKWVIAPHETDKPNIERLEKLFRVKVVRYSEIAVQTYDARVLIIDNVGILSSVYRYAYIAEVGGGFGRGIHNILEPACWGIPVLFGPNHSRFREAVDLISMGGAKCFNDYDDFAGIIDQWLKDYASYKTASETAANYVKQNIGATEEIVMKILNEGY